MRFDYFFIILIFVLQSLFNPIFCKTKPVNGYVMSDSNAYLPNVRIFSLPSKTTSMSDTNGEFSLLMPVRDRKLVFDLIGFHPDTIDAVLFENESIITLTTIIEVNYLDSVNTSIKFVVDRNDERKNSYKIDDMRNQGFNSIEHMIIIDQKKILKERMSGKKYFHIKDEHIFDQNIFFDGVKINNLGYPLFAITPISEQGLDELSIMNGSYEKDATSPLTLNFLPNITYGNRILINQFFESKDNNRLDGYGAMGFRYGTLNVSGFSRIFQKENSDSSKIRDILDNIATNIAFTNRKNFEAVIYAYQNNKNYLNQKHNNSALLKDNNLIAKFDQWSPFTGIISLHGLYQSRNNVNNNALDSIVINGECQSLGFNYEKDFNNTTFNFHTNSSITNSDWLLDEKSSSIERQNSIFSASIESYFNQNDTLPYVKEIKIVLSKERTVDVCDSSSSIYILPNNWDNNSLQLSTTIMHHDKKKKNIVTFNLGNTHGVPFLEDIINGNSISHSLLDSNSILPENKSILDISWRQDNKIEKYKFSYSLGLSSYGHYYKNKIKYIPLIGNPKTIPLNLGDTRLFGTDIFFGLNTKKKFIDISLLISSITTNDISKFQSIAKQNIKGSIFFHHRFLNLKLITSTYGERNIEYIDNDGNSQNKILDSFTDYTLQISKSFNYKYIKMTLCLIGQNLNDEKIQFDGFNLHKKQFIGEVNISMQ